MFCYIALGGEMLDWPVLELRKISNVRTTILLQLAHVANHKWWNCGTTTFTPLTTCHVSKL